jgi:aminoglycoside phosphotransferase (APT) family kinase protein
MTTCAARRSAGLPQNPVRGVPLVERLDFFEHDVVFMHGDVHRANLMQVHGSLSALIDFGDLGRGDRAGDIGGGIFSVGVDEVNDLLTGYGPVAAGTLVKAFGWACDFPVRRSAVGGRTTETAEEFLTTLAHAGH